MPREQINYPDLLQKKATLGRIASEPADSPWPEEEYGPWNESAVHVQWQGVEAATNPVTRHGHGWVQVGFEADLNYVKFAISEPNGSEPDRTFMWSPTLSPAEVDRMIAMLKRAKRKAFRKTD